MKDKYTGYVSIVRGDGDVSEDNVKIKVDAEIRNPGIDFNKTIVNKRANAFEEDSFGKLVHGNEVVSSYIIAEEIGEHSIPFALVDIVEPASAKDPKALMDIFLDVCDIHQALALTFGEVMEIMNEGKIVFAVSKLTL